MTGISGLILFELIFSRERELCYGNQIISLNRRISNTCVKVVTGYQALDIVDTRTKHAVAVGADRPDLNNPTECRV